MSDFFVYLRMTKTHHANYSSAKEIEEKTTKAIDDGLEICKTF